MGVLKLKLSTSRSNIDLKTTFETPTGKEAVATRLMNFLTSLATGTERGSPPSIAISIEGNETPASATVTFSGVATAGDTVIINGVTFTANAVAGANQWAVGASASASASGLAAAINASVTALVSGYVVASAAGAVCTVTSAFSGQAGNQTTIAKGVDDGPVMTVSSARLVGGIVDPTAQTLNF